MPASFAGQPCADPRRLYEQCRELNLSTAWVDKPNSFLCPLGLQPGTGWLLLAGSSLTAISADWTFPDLYDLSFFNELGSGVTLKSLVVCSAECLAPGARGVEAAYLVAVADRRHLLRFAPTDANYNVRDAQSGEFVEGTLDGGDPWTWEDLVDDLWDADWLGLFPGLPFTPDGAPEDIECYQLPLSEALGSVLDRLGCAAAYNPRTDEFSIVRLGVADPVAEEAMVKYDGVRVWDDYPPVTLRAAVPEKVRVLFRKLPHTRGSTPWLAKDVADPTPDAAGAEPGSLALIEDDLEALYDDSEVLTNDAALVARAAERAADYFRQARLLALPLRVVFPGPAGDAGLMPGSTVTAIRWSELATAVRPHAGLLTEVTRSGSVPLTHFPSVTTVAAVTTVNCQGGLAKLQTTDLLIATGPSGSVTLSYDEGHWTSASELDYPDGSGTVDVWFEAGALHTKLGFAGGSPAARELLSCGDGCFQGGPLTGHLPESGAGSCSGVTFPVCLACVGTPIGCCTDLEAESVVHATFSDCTGDYAALDGQSYEMALSSTPMCYAGFVTGYYLEPGAGIGGLWFLPNNCGLRAYVSEGGLNPCLGPPMTELLCDPFEATYVHSGSVYGEFTVTITE